MSEADNATVGLSEAARLLNVTIATVRRLMASGALPHARTAGGHPRFRREDVLTRRVQVEGMGRDPARAREEGRSLTSGEAARILGVSIPIIRKLVESGELSAERTAGGHRRFREDELLAWMKSRASAATPAGYTAPDPIWQWFVGDRTGRPFTHADLAQYAERWDTSLGTPDGVDRMLSLSRALFVQSWWHYNFLAASVAWSMFALETALKERLSKPKWSLEKLIEAAEGEGIIDERAREVITLGRRLRNDLVHGKDQPAFSPGAVAPIIDTTHELVARIYGAPRA